MTMIMTIDEKDVNEEDEKNEKQGHLTPLNDEPDHVTPLENEDKLSKDIRVAMDVYFIFRFLGSFLSPAFKLIWIIFSLLVEMPDEAIVLMYCAPVFVLASLLRGIANIFDYCTSLNKNSNLLQKAILNFIAALLSFVACVAAFGLVCGFSVPFYSLVPSFVVAVYGAKFVFKFCLGLKYIQRGLVNYFSTNKSEFYEQRRLECRGRASKYLLSALYSLAFMLVALVTGVMDLFTGNLSKWVLFGGITAIVGWNMFYSMLKDGKRTKPLKIPSDATGKKLAEHFEPGSRKGKFFFKDIANIIKRYPILVSSSKPKDEDMESHRVYIYRDKQSNKLKCYVKNTGYIDERDLDINIETEQFVNEKLNQLLETNEISVELEEKKYIDDILNCTCSKKMTPLIQKVEEQKEFLLVLIDKKIEHLNEKNKDNEGSYFNKIRDDKIHFLTWFYSWIEEGANSRKPLILKNNGNSSIQDEFIEYPINNMADLVEVFNKHPEFKENVLSSKWEGTGEVGGLVLACAEYLNYRDGFLKAVESPPRTGVLGGIERFVSQTKEKVQAFYAFLGLESFFHNRFEACEKSDFCNIYGNLFFGEKKPEISDKNFLPESFEYGKSLDDNNENNKKKKDPEEGEIVSQLLFSANDAMDLLPSDLRSNGSLFFGKASLDSLVPSSTNVIDRVIEVVL